MNPEINKNRADWNSLLDGLYYPSESDEPVEYLEFTYAAAPPLTVSQVKSLLLIPPDVLAEEVPEEQFWLPVATVEEWYEEAEKTRTARFGTLRDQVNATLTDRQVFRAGQTEVTLYLLGRRPDGQWATLKTLVVET